MNDDHALSPAATTLMIKWPYEERDCAMVPKMRAAPVVRVMPVGDAVVLEVTDHPCFLPHHGRRLATAILVAAEEAEAYGRRRGISPRSYDHRALRKPCRLKWPYIVEDKEGPWVNVCHWDGRIAIDGMGPLRILPPTARRFALAILTAVGKAETCNISMTGLPEYYEQTCASLEGWEQITTVPEDDKETEVHD